MKTMGVPDFKPVSSIRLMTAPPTATPCSPPAAGYLPDRPNPNTHTCGSGAKNGLPIQNRFAPTPIRSEYLAKVLPKPERVDGHTRDALRSDAKRVHGHARGLRLHPIPQF